MWHMPMNTRSSVRSASDITMAVDPDATNTLNLDDTFLIYASTTMLSVQKYSSYCNESSLRNLTASCTQRTAAISSRRTTLKTGLKGTTLHFTNMKITWIPPISSRNLRYEHAAYPVELASAKWCISTDSIVSLERTQRGMTTSPIMPSKSRHFS